jgi:hypothetical protein
MKSFACHLVILTSMLWRSANASAEGTNAPAREPPKRARVVVVHDPAATVTFTPQLVPICAMVEQAITNLTGRTTPAEAWRSLVATQDVVGLKVFSRPGPTSGTRPAVVEAVVRGLLAAGVPARQVIVWDKNIADLRQAGFFRLAERYGVRVAGSAEAGYDEKVAYETPLLGQLIWGDVEFGRTGQGVGRRSFVSKLVPQMNRIITIAPLLNHNLAGVSGHLYGLAMGSMDNTLRFETSRERMADAVPDSLIMDAFFDRLTLHITDALICQYEGEERQLLHYSRPLNELWFSRDPVALDVLAVEELDRQRQAASTPAAKASLQLYENATLVWLGVSNLRQIDVVRSPERRE